MSFRSVAWGIETRLAGCRDGPTRQEGGLYILQVPQMRGVLGSPGMAADAVTYYEDLFVKVSRTAPWQKFLAESYFDGEVLKAAELKTFLAKFEGTLRDILKEAGAKIVR